jgi:hypothetical protein
VKGAAQSPASRNGFVGIVRTNVISVVITGAIVALLAGCGGTRHKLPHEPPLTPPAQPPPPFGSGNDSERAEPLAEKIALEHVKQRHPSEKFQMVTDASDWTRTEWFAQIDGHLRTPGAPFPPFINRELKVTLGLGHNHSLRLLSYSERKVHLELHEEP